MQTCGRRSLTPRLFARYLSDVSHVSLSLSNGARLGHHRVTGQPADPQRDLHVVPEHVLLFPSQRSYLEGTFV